jgi:hypothetical protein
MHEHGRLGRDRIQDPDLRLSRLPLRDEDRHGFLALSGELADRAIVDENISPIGSLEEDFRAVIYASMPGRSDGIGIECDIKLGNRRICAFCEERGKRLVDKRVNDACDYDTVAGRCAARTWPSTGWPRIRVCGGISARPSRGPVYSAVLARTGKRNNTRHAASPRDHF